MKSTPEFSPYEPNTCYTEATLKYIIQACFELKCGFAPTADRIKIIESSSDGTYIRFDIGSHDYYFSSTGDKHGVELTADAIKEIK